jgi:hypothetical protein
LTMGPFFSLMRPPRIVFVLKVFYNYHSTRRSVRSRISIINFPVLKSHICMYNTI